MAAHRPLPPLRQHRRGVSLVEALVALAVMGFGMLALVGVQGTMRLNSDLAKQRSEATRIASEEIGRLRNFSSLAAVQGQPGQSYDEIASRTVEGYVPPDSIGNATYQVIRTVTLVPGIRQKVVTVQVRWTDRTNTQQTVTLDGAISATPPALGALLAIQTTGSPATQRHGRHPSIPVDALDLGTGTSRFEPPGSSDVAWYFNNLSGSMRVCNADGDDCVSGTLVSGAVRYQGGTAQPGAAQAESPQGPAMNLAAGPNALVLASPINTVATDPQRCYAAQYTALELAARSAVNYYCAIVPQAGKGWGGKLNPRPVDASGTVIGFAADGTAYKSCRYTAASTDYTVNADHPKSYCQERPGTPTPPALCTGRLVTGNLVNQDFLVIRGDFDCPGDDAATPLINGNTLQHQP